MYKDIESWKRRVEKEDRYYAQAGAVAAGAAAAFLARRPPGQYTSSSVNVFGIPTGYAMQAGMPQARGERAGALAPSPVPRFPL